MKINPDDPVSVETVNKKIEAFVEVVLSKMVELQTELAKAKERIKVLEGGKK